MENIIKNTLIFAIYSYTLLAYVLHLHNKRDKIQQLNGVFVYYIDWRRSSGILLQKIEISSILSLFLDLSDFPRMFLFVSYGFLQKYP